MKKILLVIWVCIAIALVSYIYNGEQQKAIVVNTPYTNSSVVQKVNQVTDMQTERLGEAFLSIADISEAMIGKGDVETIGYIVELVEKDKGHIFTQVKDINGEQKLKVILWAATIKKNPKYRDIFLDCYESRKPVFLKGKVEKYKGILELIAFEVYQQ